MERHLALLTLLARLWGGLAALVGLSVLILAAGALAESVDSMGATFAAGVASAALAMVGALAVVWGVAHLLAAGLVARSHGVGRLLMLGLALVNLLILPFGTALGIYALWVLLTPDVQRRFHQPGTSPRTA